MRGLVISAMSTGSGKTTVTLGLAAALRNRGIAVAPAKTGPDYIDAAFLTRAAGRRALNLDPWAMSVPRLRALAAAHAADGDLLLVEGVMGLFDGAADGTGSTADVAAALGLPVVLVVDAARQGQSVAAAVHGFATWRQDIAIAGLVLNRVGSGRHERMLRSALAPLGIPVLGVLPRDDALAVPSRHLGLTLPGDLADADAIIAVAADAVAAHVDLDALVATPIPSLPRAGKDGLGVLSDPPRRLPPVGQRVAIARDAAFAFLYEHWLMDWRSAGAELSFFSPLADESPRSDADAVYLPGGYPELHAGRIAAADTFRAGLTAARDRGALIYGECGGYMVLGETLTDAAGATHRMAGLLPVATRIDRPRRVLGYRVLEHRSPLPFPSPLKAHEFHYSMLAETGGAPPLFTGTDSTGNALLPDGAVVGRVMGSYAHVIDVP